jgi:predicted site-specific integrase-resolvase
VVLNQDNLSPHQELVADIIAILHSFSSRLYSLRKHTKQIQELIQESTSTQEEKGGSKQSVKNSRVS